MTDIKRGIVLESIRSMTASPLHSLALLDSVHEGLPGLDCCKDGAIAEDVEMDAVWAEAIAHLL